MGARRPGAKLSLRLASILILVDTLMAEAALPPKVYEQARELATHHVQIKVIRVAPPMKTPGECEITGDVVDLP